MKQSRATIRYAKSFIDISLEQNSLEKSYSDMVLIDSVCSSNKDFLNLENMNDIKVEEKITNKKFGQKNLLYDVLSSLREKVNSPSRRN